MKMVHNYPSKHASEPEDLNYGECEVKIVEDGALLAPYVNRFAKDGQNEDADR
jgi:hypothetical protein